MSNVPIRLIWMTLVNAARSWADSIWPSRPIVRWAQPMPAEFTTARSGATAAAALTAAVICSVSVTSTLAKTPPISAASASPLSACRSATTTMAPFAASWRATAAPMPDAAPVTMAEDPLMSMAREHRTTGQVGRAGVVTDDRAVDNRFSTTRSSVTTPTTHPSEAGGALRDDHGRAGQQHPVVGGPGDGEGAAGDVDAVRHVGGGHARHAVGERGGDHHRAGTGA